MYKKMLIGCLFCGLLACTGTLVVEDTNDESPEAPSNETNLSSADGCWFWMEDNERGKKEQVYYLEIEEGRLVSMKPLSRNAKGLTYENRRSHVHLSGSVDDDPPMIALFGHSTSNKGSSRDIRIRFDLSDSLSTFDPARDVNPGILVEEVVEDDPDDRPLPKRYRSGALVRTGC